ncbi:MAG: hypothetical protein JXR70_09705 [Spirochaetales bacterium]|nr:hypothetical protein [Spirochaetales bacterium]
MKRSLIILLFLGMAMGLAANTLFLYSYELLEGETQSFSTSINEGMMEELFETPYIAYDNVAQNNSEAFDPAMDLNDFLVMAKTGGAHYFLAVNSVSHENELNEGAGELDSEIHYFLYNAKTSELLGAGRLLKRIVFEKKTQMEKAFVEIGHELVHTVMDFFPGD